MDTIMLVGAIYLLFLAPVALGGAFVWLLVRRRIRLVAADWLLCIAPFLVWVAAITLVAGNKSLANIVEALFVGCAALAFFALRTVVTFAQPAYERRWSAVALASSCASALLVWALVPWLPE